MQVKTLPFKDTYQQHPETPLASLLRWADAKWKSVHIFKLLLEIIDVVYSKEEKVCLDYDQRRAQQRTSLMVWDCVSAHGICEGTASAERYIQVVEQHVLPSKQHLFPGHVCLFQQDNAKPTVWLPSKGVQVWTGLPARRKDHREDKPGLYHMWLVISWKFIYSSSKLRYFFHLPWSNERILILFFMSTSEH